MDKEEARAVLAQHLARWRQRSYAELEAFVDLPESTAASGPSGTAYQIEMQVFWDAGKGGNLRVVGAIDDGGLSAFKPLTEDFILAPDGTFVGE